MGKFLDRIKRFRERHKGKTEFVSMQDVELKQEESRVKGLFKKDQEKQRQLKLDRAIEKKIIKEKSLSRLREVQAKRIKFEQRILKAKASRRQQTRDIIKGGIRRPVTFRKIPVSQAPIIRNPVVSRPIGAALLDRPKKKGKGTPGLGTSFRVL